MEPAGSRRLWGPSSVLEERLVHVAGVNLPSLRGLSGPQTPPKQPPLGLCVGEGTGRGVEMCPGWGG